MAKNNLNKKAEEIVNEFLIKLSVEATAKVFAVEEYLKVEIEGKDSSLLIGFHGDNLRALKHVLSIALRKQLGEELVIQVDVSGYMEKREERIRDMAKKAVDKFKKTKRPQDLPPMNSFERRIAHEVISDAGLSSESTGFGRDRHIVINK